MASCLLLVGGAALAASPWSLTIQPARTTAPLRSVSPHYVSFALDNAFIRDPTGQALPHPPSGVPLPQDETNSTRIDFQDPLLNKIMPLVSGGFVGVAKERVLRLEAGTRARARNVMRSLVVGGACAVWRGARRKDTGDGWHEGCRCCGGRRKGARWRGEYALEAGV